MEMERDNVIEPVETNEQRYDIVSGARGEDPEFDIRETEEALGFQTEPSEPYSGRRLSESLVEFAQGAAASFAEGARHIDLSDRYNE